jgi:hypothetical protein
MAKIIEAKAVISAADKTGAVFDKIAAKFKGIEKNAKALEGIRAPKFAGELEKELEELTQAQRQLGAVQRRFKALDKQMNSVEGWRGKTLSHWRAIRSATDDADRAEDRFVKGHKKRWREAAGHFATHAALHAAGIGTGVYFAGHAIRSTIEGYGERGRAITRYEQMGLTDNQLAEGENIANAISTKFPSISRTEALDFLRTNASRLGSWDRSKQVAEAYARALIANKLSGGDEHEMEQTVRALEGMGKANTTEQLTSGLNAFARAKAANPDYTGEQFRSDMAAASSSKYGLTKDYLENVFPILASHTSGFGNKLSTGLSAMVGLRMTKTAKAALSQDGLLKDGKILDQEGWIANNFAWTQKHIRPLLEKQGINFGEDMSEADKGKVVAWLARHFSARNAADLVATNLLDAPLVEKARQRRTVGLEAMDGLQKRDPSLVWEGMMNQLKDAALAMARLGPVISLMNNVTNSLSNIEKWAQTGKVPENTNLGHWLKDQREVGFNAPIENINEAARRDQLKRQISELDQKLSPAYGLDDKSAQALRLKRLDEQIALDQSENLRTMPPIYSDAEMQRWQEDEARANASKVPMPRARPKEADEQPGMPPVQSLEGATPIAQLQGSAEVHGNADITVKVQPSSYFEGLIQHLENGLKLLGSLTANGPGSNGKSL